MYVIALYIIAIIVFGWGLIESVKILAQLLD